jgi:hypothetical protein
MNRSLRGASNIRASSQTVGSDAGIWTFNFSDFPVYSRQLVLLWRSLDALTEGQLNPIDVPFFDYEKTYQPLVDLDDTAVPHSDDAYFSDNAGYVSSRSDVSTASAGALRATSLDLSIVFSGDIEPGQHFSIDHTTKGNRLYRIKTATYTSSSEVSLTFNPPLREAVTTGTKIEFDRPVCQCKLASDQEMSLTLQPAQYGFPSVGFIEDL